MSQFKDMDLVPTLEEYDRILSVYPYGSGLSATCSTSLSQAVGRATRLEDGSGRCSDSIREWVRG